MVRVTLRGAHISIQTPRIKVFYIVVHEIKMKMTKHFSPFSLLKKIGAWKNLTECCIKHLNKNDQRPFLLLSRSAEKN